MSDLYLYGENVLETSTVLTTGDATGKPKERLWDRGIVLPWADTALTGERTIHALQNLGTVKPVSAAIVAGHNLVGAFVTIQSSPDGVTWTQRYFGAMGATDPVRLVLPGGVLTVAQWQFVIQGAAAIPSIAELVLGDAVILPEGPKAEVTEQGTMHHKTRLESEGGVAWLIEHGPVRWKAEFEVPHLSKTQRDTLLTLYQTLGGPERIFLVDAEGVLRCVEWAQDELLFQDVGQSTGQPIWNTKLRFLEALG